MKAEKVISLFCNQFFDKFVKILSFCPFFSICGQFFRKILNKERKSSKLDGFMLKDTVYEFSILTFYVFRISSELTKNFEN